MPHKRQQSMRAHMFNNMKSRICLLSRILPLFVASTLFSTVPDPAPPYYDEAKKVVMALANQDDPDPDHTKAQLALCSKGSAIEPALTKLFRENESDAYRIAILNTLSHID